MKVGNFIIDGVTFTGPYIADRDEIPTYSGIALICSEVGEGTKILAVETADNIAEFIRDSPRKPIWLEAVFRGTIDVYTAEFPAGKRESVAESIISKRKDSLSCQEIKPILDDW